MHNQPVLPVQPVQPPRHSSYENLRQGRVAYYNWLTPCNDLIRKKPVHLPPGLPVIGTFRLNTPNYEKESLTELEYGNQKPLYLSLVMDQQFLLMSSMELRVEDYYLLRMCPPNSELYKAVNNSYPVPPFNIALHIDTCLANHLPAPKLQPPNLNRPWPGNSNTPPLKINSPTVGANPFSQNRTNDPGVNFSSSFGFQGQSSAFNGNSNNNNNSGFLNQSKPFQQPLQNAFQSPLQTNTFQSPLQTNAFQSPPQTNSFKPPPPLPPASNFASNLPSSALVLPQILPPSQSQMSASGNNGQFLTPTDRLSQLFSNPNNSNSNIPLPKPPDKPMTPTVASPFQQVSDQRNTPNIANMFNSNNGQNLSNTNMYSPSMSNTNMTNANTTNTNMFSPNMNNNNGINSNVNNNNMFNANMPNANLNGNVSNANMFNSNTNTPNGNINNNGNVNMFSSPTMDHSNANMSSSPNMSPTVPSQPFQTYQSYQNIKTPLDLFLQFFYNDLIQAINLNPRIRELLKDQIQKCFIFHERSEQLKSFHPGREDNLSTPLSRKHRETLEIKKIMDGLQQDLLERQARNQFSDDFQNYAMVVWNELQEIYADRVWETRMELQGQTPGEAVKSLEEDLQQKESFFMQRLSNLHQAEPSAYCTYPIMNPRPESLDHHLSFFPNDVRRGLRRVQNDRVERDRMARYVFQIDQMRYRLKETTMAGMMEREEHLYDCERRNEVLGDVEDYQGYQRRKRRNDEVIVIVREDIKKTPQTAPFTPSRIKTERTSTKTLKKSPSVSEFSPTDSPPPIKQETVTVTVTFKVTVIWVQREHADEPFKVFQGSIQLSEPIRKPDLEKTLTKRIQDAYRQFLRGDAEYKFGELQKLKDSWDISVRIEQEKLNIPATFTFQAAYARKDGRGTRLTTLAIENKHGRIEWRQELDIAGLDFTKGGFIIGDNTVECNSECLNLPCRITFFSLPSKVARMEDKYFHAEIEEKLRKHVRNFMDMELEGIDWTKRHYSILAQQFFTAPQDVPQPEKEKEGKAEREDGSIGGQRGSSGDE